MAEASPVQGLQEEATCPICLDYYKDPVTTKCGHNFCRSCITVCSQGASTALRCPECREPCPQGDLRANRQLKNMVQLVKQLPVRRKRPREEEDLCEEHEERLKLFCEEDEKLLCVICRESSDHKQHKVHPVMEAAQRYMGELQDSLKSLREQLEAIRQSKLKEEEASRTLRNQLEAKQRIAKIKFEKLRQRLNEEEQLLLGSMEVQAKQIIAVYGLRLAKLSAEMSFLEEQVREIEEKFEQPAGELLKDIRRTLNRCEHVMPDPTPEQIKKNYKVLVTLDADSAHRLLTLSEDGRRVTHIGTDQRWPDTPKRFTWVPCVLGMEGFTSGRHYWELQLLQEGDGWVAGVVRESLSRNVTGSATESPERGVWAVQGYDGRCLALTSPPTPLSPRQPPQKLGFYLDYDGGRLSVYNAETLEELHTFTGATFTERVYPYFRLKLWCRLGNGTDLRLV